MWNYQSSFSWPDGKSARGRGTRGWPSCSPASPSPLPCPSSPSTSSSPSPTLDSGASPPRISRCLFILKIVSSVLNRKLFLYFVSQPYINPHKIIFVLLRCITSSWASATASPSAPASATPSSMAGSTPIWGRSSSRWSSLWWSKMVMVLKVMMLATPFSVAGSLKY